MDSFSSSKEVSSKEGKLGFALEILVPLHGSVDREGQKSGRVLSLPLHQQGEGLVKHEILTRQARSCASLFPVFVPQTIVGSLDFSRKEPVLSLRQGTVGTVSLGV